MVTGSSASRCFRGGTPTHFPSAAGRSVETLCRSVETLGLRATPTGTTARSPSGAAVASPNVAAVASPSVARRGTASGLCLDGPPGPARPAVTAVRTGCQSRRTRLSW